MITLIQHPVGSVWAAADGQKYGCIVTGPTNEHGETPIRRFTNTGLDHTDDSIDSFKLTYRYYQVFPQ